METLPVELLHRIFDNLDAETILFSIRPLSRLFRSVVNTYDRYILDLKLISKSNFHLLCRLIKPQNIISLVLANDKQTSDQIDLFISLVHLRQFTRLRSLTLLNIYEAPLNFILKRININLLTSFFVTVKICTHHDTLVKTTTTLLSSILSQPTLRKLEFGTTSRIIPKVSWPINCTIQYLVINGYIPIDNLFTILQCSPHLRTMIMKEGFYKYHDNSTSTFSSPISFPQLISLTIEKLNVTIDKLESFLSLTPSLIYLKLIGGNGMVDGKRWEQFVQINLLQLDKLEFFFNEWFPNKKTPADLESIIASFQTPFWTEHKKWFVSLEYEYDWSNIHLYSIPICKSSLEYQPEYKELSSSICVPATKNESTIMNNVKSLSLKLDKSIADDIQEKKATTTHPVFPKVTEVAIAFSSDWPLSSLQPLCIYINISQIVQMEVEMDYFGGNNKNTLNDIGIFLEQAHSLSSLIIDSSFNQYKLPEIIENICPIIPRQLKHLQVPINDLNHIKMILGQCDNLSTIKLDIKDKFAEDIIQWFNDNTIDSSCWHRWGTVTVWLGKKKFRSTDVQVDNKRIKLTDH